MEQGFSKKQDRVSNELFRLRKKFFLTGGIESIIPDLKLYLELRKKHGNLIDILVREYGDLNTNELERLISGLEGSEDVNN